MATYIGSTLSRGESGTAPFPTSKEADLKLSNVTVATITERDEIPEWKRSAKMRCHVTGIDKDYRLGTDVTIAGQVWTEINTTIPDNIVTEDEIFDADGYIQAALIQKLFINDAYVVTTEADMLAMTTVTGNVVVVTNSNSTDPSKTFIKLNNDDPSAIDDFSDITGNTGAVTSVNGETGAVSITMENLLAIQANVDKFNAQTASAPAVSQNTSSITTLQEDVDRLDTAVQELQTAKSLAAYTPNTAYVVDDYVVAINPANSVKELFRVTANVTDVSPYDATGSDYYEKIGDYYTKAEIDSKITDNLTESKDYTDAEINKVKTQIELSQEGIIGEVGSIAERDALTGGDDINGHTLSTGDRVMVEHFNRDRKVYSFTGTTGDIGAEFWKYIYLHETPEGAIFNVNKVAHGLVVKNVVTYKEIGSTGTYGYQKWTTGDDVAGLITAVTDANNYTVQTIGYFTGLTGLVDGSTYYAQSDGTIGTTVTGVRVLKAVSTTSGYIQIKNVVVRNKPQKFTTDGVQTDFTVVTDDPNPIIFLVDRGGNAQVDGYTVSGKTVVFTEAPDAGMTIGIHFFANISITGLPSRDKVYKALTPAAVITWDVANLLEGKAKITIPSAWSGTDIAFSLSNVRNGFTGLLAIYNNDSAIHNLTLPTGGIYSVTSGDSSTVELAANSITELSFVYDGVKIKVTKATFTTI